MLLFLGVSFYWLALFYSGKGVSPGLGYYYLAPFWCTFSSFSVAQVLSF